MPQETEAFLRNALGSVDRNRRRGYFRFGVPFVVNFAILLWALRTTDLHELLLVTCILVGFAVVYGVIAVAIYINRMARLILQAIVLLRVTPPVSSSMPSSSAAAPVTSSS
jgi:hypothetical protein